ncbi:MAG: DoxX family protein [Chryseolinea sp.]
MKNRIIFWTSTSFIFLFEGVMPALTSHTELARNGVTHLGYPVYFVAILAVAKVLGALALIIPAVPKTIKEWAYAGFTFNLLSAATSLCVVDGFVPAMFFPLVILGILGLSYTSYKKLVASRLDVVSFA